MIDNKFPPIQNPPLSGEVLSEKTVLSTVDIYKSFNQNIQPLPTSTMPDEITKAILCQTNCSGNGECRDGSCYCMVMLLVLIDIYLLEIKILMYKMSLLIKESFLNL